MSAIGRERGNNLPILSELRQPPLAADPVDDLALALEFARAEKSASTRRAYRSDFHIFRKWCETRGLDSLPAAPPTVAAFLASEAKRGSKVSTLERRLAGIRYAHLLAGCSLPGQSETVKATFRGIRRMMGAAPSKKEPITAEHIRAMAKIAPRTVAGLRDRALLLLCFAGAFRRSELVALDLSDIKEIRGGLLVRIRGSKTDQERKGQTIAIAPGHTACPAKAVKAWLKAADIKRGPVFRRMHKGGRISTQRLSSHAVAETVKFYAAKIGMDAALVSAHSLRTGFLTSAAQRGASIFKLMDVSRHKSVETLRSYIRDRELFDNHAGSGLL